MIVNEEKYNWLIQDKSIVVDGQIKLRRKVKVKCIDKTKPALIAICNSYWSCFRGYSSYLILIES